MTQGQDKGIHNLAEQVREAERKLVALSVEAASSDPAVGSRLNAALRALRGTTSSVQNTAILSAPSDIRALVRDVVAEELARYWERRFGGTP